MLLLGLTLFTQLNRKKKAIGGKILSVVLIMVISVGTYYIGKANGALDKITGGNYKIDNMVVAVLKDDPAKDIKDTENYTFGVQYKMGRTDMEAAIQMVSEELGKDITVVEYQDLQEQAEALHDKKVMRLFTMKVIQIIFLSHLQDIKRVFVLFMSTRLRKNLPARRWIRAYRIHSVCISVVLMCMGILNRQAEVM